MKKARGKDREGLPGVTLSQYKKTNDPNKEAEEIPKDTKLTT